MNVQGIQGEKYYWRLPTSDTQHAWQIASSYNLSLPIAQTLVCRGMTEKDALDAYLFSVRERDVATADLLKGAPAAVERIIAAIEREEKILIFGDYDVDGVTSTSMMMICLLNAKAKVNFFLPHRQKDGYGISAKIVERAAKSGYKLIITVDNGITAFEAAQRAQELGVDLIITDHHKPHGHLPPACAIIDPQQADCAYPFKLLAGVGVSFKILSLLYDRLGLVMPLKAYELLLLGTVADVVPLIGENRFWVRHGLQQARTAQSYAFTVLKQNGNITKPWVNSLDIGFSIAPQINALGRLEDPREAVAFLIGTDQQKIDAVGKTLFELNQARKTVERAILDDIEAMIAAQKINVTTDNIIIASHDSWPSGVIGLVASRLVSSYGKPAMLLHRTKDGMARGSCRSIAEFDMFAALEKCSDLLSHFGGHAHAAGVGLPADKIPALRERLNGLVAACVAPEDLRPKLEIDAPLTLPDVTKKMMDDLAFLEPFGNANKQPLFMVRNATLLQGPTLLKDAHVKCLLFADGVMKPIIFFNRPDLFGKLQEYGQQPFDVAVHVVENYWHDSVSIELQGLDVAFNKDSRESV